MDTTLQDPLIGRLLDGRYRIEQRIAVGGMATVYRATDARLDRVVALKVMHPALAANAGSVDRFIREARSTARLDHPNIVGVLDQGTDGGYVYLAMEYVAGCTLRDVLGDRGALPPRAVLDIVEPMLAGLAAAHRAGLIHRDIKPENVLIGDDGRVKVADFGLVRTLIGAPTNTGVVISRNTADSAIYLEDTTAVISKNTLANSNTHAIQLADNDDGTVIHRNTIINPEWSGIRFTTGNANVVVSKNSISSVGIEGIYLGSSTTGSTFNKNKVVGSTRRGVLVDPGSTGNTFTNNKVKGSAQGPDVQDDSVGAGTLGTGNTYSGNICGTSDPNGLC